MENQNSNKTFRLIGSLSSVLALVVGIPSLLVSFVPLLGALALYPSIFAFACAIIGLVMAIKAGSSTGASITGLVITLLALLFSYGSYVIIKGETKPIKSKQVTLKKIKSEKVEVQTENQETEESPHKKIEDLGDGWNRFYHRYYDFSLELPNILKESMHNLEPSGYLKSNNLTTGGTQYYHSEDEKIKDKIFISVSDFTSELNKKYFEESYKEYLDDKNVPYKIMNDNWYVVSGYEDKERIFYRKAFFKNNHTYFLNISYKTNIKKEIEPLLDRIQKSFK
ncbi:MAG: hypothetical protein EAZ20_14445 [Bacteroidetes bacterium]|nr:MAG: hypothetical protein EAZ20_14445 [Bacteroidota bacterium]